MPAIQTSFLSDEDTVQVLVFIYFYWGPNIAEKMMYAFIQGCFSDAEKL